MLKTTAFLREVLAALSKFVGSTSRFLVSMAFLSIPKYKRQKDLRTCLESVEDAKARQAAQSRKEFLSKYSTPLPEIIYQEVLELPPGLGGVSPVGDMSQEDACGQMVRLRWQLESDELLLLERVVDSIICLFRTEGSTWSGLEPEKVRSLLPLVCLAPLDANSTRAGYFPWKVVVETLYPEIFEPYFLSLRDWLGVGIDFAKPTQSYYYAHCQSPGGREGTVGGLVSDGRSAFPMTCAHVLSDICQSLVERGEPSTHGQQPDAALINLRTPCFPEVRNNTRARIIAQSSDIQQHTMQKTPIVNARASISEIQGAIYSRVSAFPISGNYYRFPHVQITPIRTTYFGIITVPFFVKNFSQPGHSGSWVVETQSGAWIGMIVGGDPYMGMSFAAEARSLVDYFDIRFAQTDPTYAPGNLMALSLQ